MAKIPTRMPSRLLNPPSSPSSAFHLTLQLLASPHLLTSIIIQPSSSLLTHHSSPAPPRLATTTMDDPTSTSSLSRLTATIATSLPSVVPTLHHGAPHSQPGGEPAFAFLNVLLSKFGVALDITKLGSLIIAASLAWSWWNSFYLFLSLWVNRLLWCSLEVDSTSADDCFDQLIAWLAAQPFSNDSNLLRVSQTTAKMELEPWGYYRKATLSDEEKNLEFTPATGTHRFWYKVRLFFGSWFKLPLTAPP